MMMMVMMMICITISVIVYNIVRRNIQTFVNRCLRYILRIWWANVISNKDLWRVTGQEDTI